VRRFAKMLVGLMGGIGSNKLSTPRPTRKRLEERDAFLRASKGPDAKLEARCQRRVADLSTMLYRC